MACQEPKEGNGLPCNKRVDSGGFCGACGRAGKAAPRFNLRCKFADYGDSAWLTTFHEGACQVLDMKAEDAQAMEAGERLGAPGGAPWRAGGARQGAAGRSCWAALE